MFIAAASAAGLKAEGRETPVEYVAVYLDPISEYPEVLFEFEAPVLERFGLPVLIKLLVLPPPNPPLFRDAGREIDPDRERDAAVGRL